MRINRENAMLFDDHSAYKTMNLVKDKLRQESG